MDKKEFYKKIDTLINLYRDKKFKNKPVIYKTTKEIEKIINPISFKPKEYSEIWKQIEFYIENSVQSSHPHFNNQLYAGDSEMGFIGEIISYITNNSMATFEVSPVANIIEEKVVKKINKLIGFKNGDGIMVTGGSNANLLAMHCARNTYSNEIKLNGNENNNFVVFVSEDSHYSFLKAINLLGIGQNNLILIPTKSNGKMSIRCLKSEIKKSLKQQKIPLMIVSTAGTTIYGAFDEIDKIDIIAKKYSIWHHVDAAWGGPALFSKKLSKKMKGIHNVDSVAWDAHKLMRAGITTSFILLKNKGILLEANSTGGEKYLFHNYENNHFDSGTKSLQCGRKNDILKLWFSWQYIGDSGYRNLIKEQRNKALYLTKILKNDKNFILIKNPEYLNVCFQIKPKNKQYNINIFNKEIRYILLKKSSHMVNIAGSPDGKIFFRYTFSNNNTKFSDIDDFIKTLLKLKKQL